MKKIFLYPSISLIFALIMFMILLNSCKNDDLLNIKEQEESIKAPDSLNIISLSETSLKLTWKDNSTSELHFVVEKGDGYIPQSFKEIGTVATNVTEFEDTNLDKTKIYSYRVKAVGEYLVSDYSPKISAEISDGVLLRSYIGHNEPVNTIAISSNGQILATGGLDNTIILWNIATGNQLYQLTEHYDDIISLDFSSDGTMLASSSDDNWIILWNVQTGDTIRKIQIWSANPNSISFSPDNQSIAAGLSNYYLPIWDISTGGLITNLTLGYSGSPGISSIDFSSDGTKIVCFYGHSEIRMWNVTNFSELWFVQVTAVGGGYVSFRPDGNSFASSAYDLELRQTNNGNVIRKYDTPGYSGYPVCFSKDGQRLASGGDEVKIWNVNTGELLFSIKDQTSYLDPVIFANSDDQIITPLNDINNSTYGANLWKLESEWVAVP